MLKTNYDTLKELNFRATIDESKRHHFGIGISKHMCIICGEKRKDVDKYGVCPDCNKEFPIKISNADFSENLKHKAKEGLQMNMFDKILNQTEELVSLINIKLEDMFKDLSFAIREKDLEKIQRISEDAKYLKQFYNSINEFKDNFKNKFVKPITFNKNNIRLVNDQIDNYNFYKKKKIDSFIFEGKVHSVKTWQDLLLQLCNILYSKNPPLFENTVLQIKGSQRPYFAKEERKIKNIAKKLTDTNIFVETKFDSNSIVKLCHTVLQSMNLPINLLEIKIRDAT